MTNFKSFKEIKESINQATNVKLDADEYALYKQEKQDGIWYVGYELLTH